jgi:hypothetical protein
MHCILGASDFYIDPVRIPCTSFILLGLPFLWVSVLHHYTTLDPLSNHQARDNINIPSKPTSPMSGGGGGSILICYVETHTGDFH